MKVTVDMDPRDVWRYQAAAEARGVLPGDVLRDELATRRNAAAIRDRIRELVTVEKKCDADIAAELNYVPGRVAEIRRGMGLPANPRFKKQAAGAAERKTA